MWIYFAVPNGAVARHVMVYLVSILGHSHLFLYPCLIFCVFFSQLGYSKVMAGALSTAFEIGGVAGSASLGFIMDR